MIPFCATDSARYEALRAAREAERKAWSRERDDMQNTIAGLRLEVWTLRRALRREREENE